MRAAYPELVESENRVTNIIRIEEEQFARTLSIGWKEMEEDFARIVHSRAEEVRESRNEDAARGAFRRSPTSSPTSDVGSSQTNCNTPGRRQTRCLPG